MHHGNQSRQNCQSVGVAKVAVLMPGEREIKQQRAHQRGQRINLGDEELGADVEKTAKTASPRPAPTNEIRRVEWKIRRFGFGLGFRVRRARKKTRPNGERKPRWCPWLRSRTRQKTGYNANRFRRWESKRKCVRGDTTPDNPKDARCPTCKRRR